LNPEAPPLEVADAEDRSFPRPGRARRVADTINKVDAVGIGETHDAWEHGFISDPP
jgi:hypothetical protein